MAFAIFYEPADVSQIAGSIEAVTLPNNLKQIGRKYWNGGLNAWATAPLGHSPDDPPELCPTCRMIVISGPQVSLSEFRQLLRDISTFLGTESSIYLQALADDMGGRSGAIEPWPEV